jgi:signal transduction histidine kinase/FixJ family two-component response regulator
MKLNPTVAAIPLLFLLLTWLSFRAVNTDAEVFDRAIGSLERFAMIESALQRDVLSARVGTLRNYDPLVKETDDLDASLVRLRETAAVDAETAASIDRLAVSIASQDALIEEFKSSNALLHNSLAYFGLYSTSLGAPDQTGPLIPAVSGLAAAMLHLTLDTSPATAGEVEHWLVELARRSAPPGNADAVGALLAHGGLLLRLLPETDRVLTALRAVPLRRDRDDLRSMVLDRQVASRAEARKFRLLLYIASLLLVVILVHLGMQLRTRALALRRRAAFEHAIADISTRFINAQPNEIGTQIEHALAELAELIAADRAYLVTAATSTRPYVWSRNGIDSPPDWPGRAAEVASRFRQGTAGIIRVPLVDRLGSGETRTALKSAGLHGWVCVLVPCESGRGMITLGFDAMRVGAFSRHAEFGLLRMALDAVINALRRGHFEQEKGRLEQRLQQSRRMETVGALTSGIAHNFNNIIAAILGYAEIAEAQVVSDSRPAQSIAEIRRAGERARDLIEQILAFGRRRETRRQPVCLQNLLAETTSLLEVSLPPGIELAVDEGSKPAIIVGDHAQLQQVILNLCNNAAQAMSGSGRIEMETKIHLIERTQSLSHGDLPPGRYVCIAIGDSGRGMDEAIISRIFEPFFTTRVAGNGLGLATVSEIVREHRGAMNVRSAPGAGSRFEAWLPCTFTDAVVARKETPALPLGRGETVLVVDEERDQLLRDEEILAALGYEPVGFTRSEDALMACRDAPTRFDVVMVGHLVPPASTLGLATALHAIAPRLPIILATVSGNETAADALVAAGISDVVHWPIIATEMAAALAGNSAVQMSEQTALANRTASRNPERQYDGV